jgi:AcrR family transcriptional regulator
MAVPDVDLAHDRDEIIDLALEAFANHGIDASEIGGIDAHFPTKVALLEAAVERHVQELARMATLMDTVHFGDDTRMELTLLARFVLAEHDRQDVLLRIMLQEGDKYPELATLIREKIVAPGYTQAADWIRAHIDEGGFPDYDADAVAVVALGSLLAYAAQRRTFGGPPLGVDTERFIETWVEAWLRVAQTAEAERHS